MDLHKCLQALQGCNGRDGPGCPPAGGRLEAVSSSARWEDVVGYSRAVKRGSLIFVSGKW